MAQTVSTNIPPSGEAFYHKPSDRWYRVLRRNGSPFLRRWQIGYKGVEANVQEQSIDYAIGSGMHARTFLHRAADGRLFELPLSWYSANGGYWAMSPGYDRPDHADFRRKISDKCLFCHAAYPAESPGLQAVDCQRCHGPGAAHLANPRRGTIVNPKGQTEVCLQCHLETTSRALPDSMIRPGRTMFSYRPGEPLTNYRLHFDHAPGRGFDGKFEVNGAAYRLMQSKCYQSSKLGCTNCHEPHHARKINVTAACQQCHAAPHTTADCAGCHMPKRRTEDAIHVVLTDHKIQRKTLAEILAPLRELTAIYRGPVIPFYPRTADPALLAVAQVRDASNLEEGIRTLAAIPGSALELGDAYKKAGRYREAAEQYRRANALVPLGEMLVRLGQFRQARTILERQAASPEASYWLGLVVARQGDLRRSIELLTRSAKLQPESPTTWLNLGVSFEQASRFEDAEAAYRHAIRWQPEFAEAHEHLAALLEAGGLADEASYERQLGKRLSLDTRTRP